MWEIERHHWSQLRGFNGGHAGGVPDGIRGLIVATDDADAEQAYSRIEGVVVSQGSLYESAVPATAALMIALCHAAPAGRARIVDVLFQIANGTAAPEEAALGQPDLAKECLSEISRGVASLFWILESSTNETELSDCIDTLALCAVHDASLRVRTRWFFERWLRGPVGGSWRAHVESWVAKLS